MLLDHLGMGPAARAIHNAVANVLKAGTPLTPDLGGQASTVEVGDSCAVNVK
jgi:tartrate dehydrogenase/decarboxylase/D-malate dehydrogenase